MEFDELYLIAGHKGKPDAQTTTFERQTGSKRGGSRQTARFRYDSTQWLSNTYVQSTVNHSKDEYARDNDSDGKQEVHVSTLESFWSLLRPWLRPHRGISQERLSYYLGFFGYLYSIRKRGQVAIAALIGLLLAT